MVRMPSALLRSYDRHVCVEKILHMFIQQWPNSVKSELLTIYWRFFNPKTNVIYYKPIY